MSDRPLACLWRYALVLVLCWLAVPVAAVPEPAPLAPADVVSWHTTLRFAGGLSQPFGDLANDDPRGGWVGGQGLGYAAHAGVRIPLMHEMFVRPELSFYGFRRHHDPAVPVLVFNPSSTEPDTTSADWTRRTLMGGLRVHIDYIPADRGLVAPFLTGGLGLVYMRVADDILIRGVDDVAQNEETLGLSAIAGVGLLIGHIEVVLAGTFQEPGFIDVGSVSWFTADLSLGFTLGFARE